VSSFRALKVLVEHQEEHLANIRPVKKFDVVMVSISGMVCILKLGLAMINLYTKYTHTHTTVLRLCGNCPGQPG